MLTDKQFRALLAEHVTDDRAERALREEREAWLTRERLAAVRVDNRVWDLENKLMEMRCEYESA